MAASAEIMGEWRVTDERHNYTNGKDTLDKTLCLDFDLIKLLKAAAVPLAMF